MRIVFCLASIVLVSCGKKETERTATAVASVQYEVVGTALQYRVGYHDAQNNFVWETVNSGWTKDVPATVGRCYQLRTIPQPQCDVTGTSKILFDGEQKQVRNVTTFVGQQATNDAGGLSCGTTIEACN